MSGVIIEYIAPDQGFSAVSPPRPPRFFVERSALLSDMLKDRRPFFIIRGGAGYGKTELARQFCARSGKPAAWYSAAAEEPPAWSAGPQQGTVSGGAQTADAAASADARDAAAARDTGDAANAPNAPNAFAAGDMAALGEPSAGGSAPGCGTGGEPIIIIDDYKSGDQADRRLGRLLGQVSRRDGGQLILITREDVPERFAPFAARGECRIVDETDLAFSEEEQRLLLEGILGAGGEASAELSQNQGLLAERFRKCAKMLEGWPAGLMLTLYYLQKSGAAAPVEDWLFFAQAALIEGLLNRQVFMVQQPSVQEFMLKTAASFRVEEDFCVKALGIGDARSFIRELVRKNILIHVHTEGTGVFRYHRFFRMFLCGKLSSGEHREGARRAAEYYLEEKRWGQAAAEAADAGYTELIVKLAALHGESLLSGTDDSALRICVEYLEEHGVLAGGGPKEAEPADPGLLGTAAQYYYKTGEYGRAETYLNQADSSFGKENRYGTYRSLYRGLLRYGEDPDKYGKQVRSALFVLRETRQPLPYLREAERQLLEKLSGDGGRAAGCRKKLQVTVFGEFQVKAGGSRMLSWRTRKSRELFALLVDLDGGAVGRKQLLQKLWHDELPDNAVTMLHNMFYNIRKELSPYQMADVISYKDKMYRIDMSQIETDLTEIRQLCAVVERKDAAELEKNAERFCTYWGRYLEDLDCQWGAEAGEYYDVRFFSGCLMLAELCMKRDDWQQAAAYLRNALLVNPYSEESVCLLIRCYAAMKNRRLVKEEFERFRELLKRDLNTQPGKEAEQAYREALAG
ncbi:BTAD domain-containing putative transcriptional regulator [Bacilliculturomica massiliensis]|uniref:BTAD domain-containing putative transcriptional regulator n=1 Tax=Bacilliculturomica massiliensis TaxID=1917867 RepID=UPI00102FCB82|nr:BTAD domain-containing putative transcriptional regulator [Bacilliculturomica massiliensis]